MFDLEKNTEKLLDVLKSSNISLKEFHHRERNLREAEALPGSAISSVSDRYYSLAHEIKSMAFLQNFGIISVAEDANHHAGCDFILNDHYQIECVCCSAGNAAEESGLASMASLNNLDGKIIDYGREKAILYSRLTNSIKEKTDFFSRHVKKGTLNPQKPYIIFLGLGSLSLELFAGEFGIEITSILFGKGNPTFLLDPSTGKLHDNGYTHEKFLRKYNGAMLDCNIFMNSAYNCVSGIIVSAADLSEEYSAENTWMFINPFACTHIIKKDFSGMVYWDKTAQEYYPRRKYRRIY